MPKSRTRGINCEKKQEIGVIQSDGYYKIVRILSKDDRPLWTLFIEYINSIEIGQEITRTDVLENTYITEVAPALRSKMNTVDTYRLYACRLGYLDIKKRGIYIKKHNIPTNVKLTIVKSLVYNNHPWEEWFIPKNQRRKEIEKICNK